MALVESKSKIEGGWKYRGFEVLKTEAGNWEVNKMTNEIEMNDNVELFLSKTHKQLKRVCEVIDGLYDGIPYKLEKTVKERTNENKVKESWDKFYSEAREKKCNVIFEEIFRKFKGLHYGEHKKDIDNLGNVTYFWYPNNTDFAEWQGYPEFNKDELEEIIAPKYKEVANIKFLDSYRLSIEILLSKPELDRFVIDSIP